MMRWRRADPGARRWTESVDEGEIVIVKLPSRLAIGQDSVAGLRKAICKRREGARLGRESVRVRVFVQLAGRSEKRKQAR